MRFKSAIVEWNDERGFGFVLHPKTKQRIFFHIKDFRAYENMRPAYKQEVTFELAKDVSERFKAVKLRPSGEKSLSGRPLGWVPDLVIAVLYILVPCLLTMLGYASISMLKLWGVCVCIMSFISFIMYLNDKNSAQKNQWRIPEFTLQFVGLLGGWLGALCAQKLWRHKLSKRSYVRMFRLIGMLGIGTVPSLEYLYTTVPPLARDVLSLLPYELWK